MRVKDKRVEHIYIYEIDPGDIFEDSSGRAYMKLNGEVKTDGGNIYNAVTVEDGSLEAISVSTNLYLINAEVVVK